MAEPRIAAPHAPRKERRGKGAQMRLIEVPERSWDLDDHTREIGRLGLRQAREALRRAQSDQAA